MHFRRALIWKEETWFVNEVLSGGRATFTVLLIVEKLFDSELLEGEGTI